MIILLRQLNTDSYFGLLCVTVQWTPNTIQLSSHSPLVRRRRYFIDTQDEKFMANRIGCRMPRLLVTLLTFHTANANASSACTKSLAIYYSDSFTNSRQRRVEKFPYAVIRADERRRTPNGNKINALHLVSFDVNVDFLCQERKWRPANTYKLIRKLVPLEMNRRQKRTQRLCAYAFQILLWSPIARPVSLPLSRFLPRRVYGWVHRALRH